ncbi:hypothetical protein VTN00DRAFT_9042 [Thermoascus crustaceus]|uniref:uncharacterized protein n=1 Tax=Thermoascus crustaceus TaxID=5088 RepID=UPI0037421BCF
MVCMRRLLQTAVFGLSILSNAAALPHTKTQTQNRGTNISTSPTWDFPLWTWVENLAVRSNGQILATVLQPEPTLWQIDPSAKQNGEKEPTAIHSWPDKNALLGIAETEPDVFAVVAAEVTFVPEVAQTPGSAEIWRVDLRDDNSKEPSVSLTTRIPEAGFLNGLTVLPPPNNSDGKSTILIADSILGAVWAVDPRSGSYAQIIQDPMLAPLPNGGPGAGSLGINGLHVLGEYLYFSNTSRRTFVRVPVDGATGRLRGPFEIMANLTDVQPDDFALDREGNAYIAGSDKVTRVSRDGGDMSVVTDASAVLGCTSAAWGRTPSDSSTLYVTAHGGVGEDIAVRGGRVVAVQLGESR